MFACFLSVSSALAAPKAPACIDYNHDVRPILSDRCYSCHGPDEGQRKTAMRLDHADGAFAELSGGGRPIVPGNPEESAVLHRVLSDDPARRMPPAHLGHDPLSEAEIEVLRRWIDEGADWKGHWAFQAPVRPVIPLAEDRTQVRNEIDALVL